jgi:hypothetical protein
MSLLSSSSSSNELLKHKTLMITPKLKTIQNPFQHTGNSLYMFCYSCFLHVCDFFSVMRSIISYPWPR